MNQPLNVAPPVSSELNLRAHWMPFSANRNFQKDRGSSSPPKAAG